MLKLKNYAAAATIFVCVVATADDSDCNEYVTKICGSGADVTTSQTKLEDYIKDNSDNAQQSDQSTGADEQESSSAESAGTGNAGTEAGSSAQGISSEGISSEKLKQYRDGTTSERLKYVGHKLFTPLVEFVKNWLDVLTLALATLAALLAFYAWRTSRKDFGETKKANALQLKPYFEFVDARLSWATNIAYFKPYVVCILGVKNVGQSVAVDVRHPRVSLCNIRLDGNTTSLDTDKYESSIATTVSESMAIDQALSEEQIKSFFPSNEISRAVVSPGEVVNFMLIIPVKDAMEKINSQELVADPWKLVGSFSFADSFGDRLRTCDFRVQFSQRNLAALGDGTVMEFGKDGGKSVAGKLSERRA